MEIDTFVGEGNLAGTGGGVENWSAVVNAGLCECARGHSWVQLELRDSRSYSLFLLLVSKGCKLVGCGFAVPSLQVSNDDLAKVVDTSDEWISVRTGIHNRRVLTGVSSNLLESE
ncbi:hypothetical protein LOK49_LG09G00648 [Camellia lanceoleosa]|uniref:Uncharacterized protein n=1 Tax=Camellia lanceoleosa TaxID=1840588 RepID=A0ACC0GKR0_9ERIC|nr:hypothetical protein LOK49_LG09G00648 [Camellia lanceoleosa]